ncbi:unnamed protein product [Effrenium voratum]|nr:unnamed protein product [Effrenium voratum]
MQFLRAWSQSTQTAPAGPADRFRRSIRLEATRRSLRGQYFRQGLVWICSFGEVIGVAAVPGVHLATSPYISVGVFIVMVLLTCWRAGSVMDVVWQPAHLLRPKNYSRFGIGQKQTSSRIFFALSMLLRLVCGVILGATFFRFASDQEGWKTCDAAWLPWARYHSHLYSDADLCKEDPEISEWCETISGFERRCENSSASAALGFAEDMGLQCTNATELQLLSDLVDSDSWGHYCEANNGTKVNCSKDLWSHLDPHLVVLG